MAEIPPSTPTADATVAQTRRVSAASLERSRGANSATIPFGFGPRLLPDRAMPERRRRKKTDPLYRPLHIYALDPAQASLDGRVAVVNVPWEPLQPGPTGRLFEVASVGPAGESLEKLNLDDTFLLLDRGVRPTTSDGRFHRQMTYAVCSSVYNAFFNALGRDLSWGFRHRPRLLLRPFAFEGKNAFYDPLSGEVQFGYFEVDYSQFSKDTVYTSLSHDIIAHELTHALLDGLRRNFTIPSNPDVLAFHEALGDLVAIFHHFSYPEIVRAAIRDSRGDLGVETILSRIAQQFGEGAGLGGALRTAIDFRDGVPTKKYGDVTEPHELGAVLVAAVFDSFTRVFRTKMDRFLRLATGGSGKLPEGQLSHDLLMLLADEASKLAAQFLSICIRAIDYCPPVDITFGEFLRAVITADRDLVPDDPWAYREAWLSAFRMRQIFPDDVRHMSEDAIEWRPPELAVMIEALNYAKLHFAGDPAHVVSDQEVKRQANALGDAICQRDRLHLFGLVAPNGRDIDPPQIESIRTSRRIGPDGQVTFDLVAEVTQVRRVSVEGRTFPFYGGATIIIGPDGEIRYVVGKSVSNEKRLERQATFIAADDRFWVLSGLVTTPSLQPFKILHGRER
ncbi:MAG TPA: peptidase M4 [Thermoanaerobaculia bacterium]|nr:peptidase M4 [Thermoanaerobaculia bacterium]